MRDNYTTIYYFEMGSGASVSVDKELDEVPSMIDYDTFYEKVGDRLSEEEKLTLFEKCMYLYLHIKI